MMISRRFLSAGLLGWLAVSVAARAEVPALLNDALQKISLDVDRWAYTQAMVEKNGKGKIVNASVVRFDPSKPYSEQFTPVLIDGKPPTEAMLAKYRRRGEKRGERIEKEGSAATDRVRKSLGELMDIDRATVAEENARSVIYEVPLKKEGNSRMPPEKFRVLARVNKETRAFERIEAKLREPMRAAVVVKVKSGEGALEFAPVDAKFSPQAVAIRGTGTFSTLLVPWGRDYELKREEFKRVKPYSDRFGVQIGPLKAIDF